MVAGVPCPAKTLLMGQIGRSHPTAVAPVRRSTATATMWQRAMPATGKDADWSQTWTNPRAVPVEQSNWADWTQVGSPGAGDCPVLPDRYPYGIWSDGGNGGLAASHLTCPIRLQRWTTSFLVYRRNYFVSGPRATKFTWCEQDPISPSICHPTTNKMVRTESAPAQKELICHRGKR